MTTASAQTDLTPADLVFRKLTLAELQQLVEWAQQEGWNPGLSDAELFYSADPEGFYGCFLEQTMLGGGSIVSYEGRLGFMGFFIVKPEYRSLGIGTRLWHFRRDTLLSRLQPGAAIGMDGVVAMQPFYQKGGFEIAFRDERYQLAAQAYASDSHISAVNNEDLPGVLAYDLQCFGVPRKGFMTAWLHQPHAQAFQYRRDEQLKGFAVIRQCVNGFKIGPLFADDLTVAEALYQTCLSHVPAGEPVFIDIPLANPEAVSLIRKFNASYVFECARMYYGTPPALCLDKVFGITSFELG